jgi:hypothetical protein
MKFALQGIVVLIGIIAIAAMILSAAVAWGPHPDCAARQFPKIVGCAFGSYEGLAGGLIGAGGGLMAAWIAWLAIQRQISASAETEERHRQDQAIRRLTDFSVALRDLYIAHTRMEGAVPAAREAEHQRVKDAASRPALTAAMVDPTMGKDRDSVEYFITAVTTAAAARELLHPTKNLASNTVFPLFIDLTDGVANRIQMLQKGTRVDDLYEMATVDYFKYVRTATTGETPFP